MDFLVTGILETDGEGGENGGFFIFAGADDEGKAEFGFVGGVEGVEGVDFGFGELRKAGGGLLGGGFAGEFAFFGEAADEIRVSGDEGDLFGLRGGLDGGDEGIAWRASERLAKGRFFQVRSAIQGECSKNGPQIWT